MADINCILSSTLPALTFSADLESVTYLTSIDTGVRYLDISMTASCPTCTADGPDLANYCFHCTTLSELAAIDGLNSLTAGGNVAGTGPRALLLGDAAFVFGETIFAAYLLMESAGAVHSPPDVIVPDTNAGDFWWQRMDLGMRSIEVYSETNIAVSESRVITHSSDPNYERMLTVVADGYVSFDYTVSLTSATQTTITNNTAGTHSAVELRVVL